MFWYIWDSISGGLVSTSSSDVIDYEGYSVHSFVMSITVSDGKDVNVKQLLIDVTNVNEAPIFLRDIYFSSGSEGGVCSFIMCWYFSVNSWNCISLDPYFFPSGWNNTWKSRLWRHRSRCWFCAVFLHCLFWVKHWSQYRIFILKVSFLFLYGDFLFFIAPDVFFRILNRSTNVFLSGVITMWIFLEHQCPSRAMWLCPTGNWRTLPRWMSSSITSMITLQPLQHQRMSSVCSLILPLTI